MPQAKRARRSPSVKRTRATSKRAAGPVRDFEQELERFDRELGEALARAPSRGPTNTIERWLEWGRDIDWSALLDRVDGIRGSERVDEFGLDPAFEDLIAPLFTFLYRSWWRVET